MTYARPSIISNCLNYFSNCSILTQSPPLGQSNCPDDWHGFEGICYRTHSISTRVTWDEAQEECKSIGRSQLVEKSWMINMSTE